MLDFSNHFLILISTLLGGLFISLLPDYEKTCLVEFVENLGTFSWFNEQSDNKEVGVLLT